MFRPTKVNSGEPVHFNFRFELNHNHQATYSKIQKYGNTEPLTIRNTVTPSRTPVAPKTNLPLSHPNHGT